MGSTLICKVSISIFNLSNCKLNAWKCTHRFAPESKQALSKWTAWNMDSLFHHKIETLDRLKIFCKVYGISVLACDDILKGSTNILRLTCVFLMSVF